jgi:purine-binding chemotaxis protein CheW
VPDDIDIVVFELAQQTFGLPTVDVSEILLCVRIVPMPKAPTIVEGIIDIRGTVVPVLDIRSRFGIPAKPAEPADRLILANVAGRRVAVRVDRVTDLVHCAAAEIEDGKAAAPGNEYVAGVAKLADGLVLIHDLRTFLSQSEAATLDAWLEQAKAQEAPP